MTASTLRKVMEMGADARLAEGTDARELPHRSNREIEAVFATQERRRPLLGLIIAVTFSGAVWGALAALVF